jgi:transcriptional regulator with XRE-family HTH domain
MSSSTETQAFAQRLKQALEASGVRISPTVVANEFNLRYWGRSVTPHTARNWLLGKSIPTQDKLRVLADWLQVGPDELRFGQVTKVPKGSENMDFWGGDLNMADREMVTRYMSLSVHDRKTAREVVAALQVAASIRAKP